VTPKVSVIMPFVGETEYLAEAIESVRAQTLDDWELLLVDDGRVPDAVAIASSYVQSEPRRVRLLSSGPGAGAAAARNTGIAAARGDYLAFLDADDVFEPRKLEVEATLLTNHPRAAMLYGPTRWWFPSQWWRNRTERLGVDLDRIHEPPRLLLDVIVRRCGDIPCTCGILVRREVAVRLGGFEERFRLYEDQSLLAKVLLRHPAYVCSHANARYRNHSASTSARAVADGEYEPYRPHIARREFLAWLSAHAAESGLEVPGLTREIAAESDRDVTRFISRFRRLWR
jgi:glycosyltransferase involved in cell wall biosynthesis